MRLFSREKINDKIFKVDLRRKNDSLSTEKIASEIKKNSHNYYFTLYQCYILLLGIPLFIYRQKKICINDLQIMLFEYGHIGHP